MLRPEGRTPDEVTAAAERTSQARSARYEVACPTCGAAPNQPCRTRTSRRVTETHMARPNAFRAERTADLALKCARLTRERDRARAIAVALEAEVAQRGHVEQATSVREVLIEALYRHGDAYQSGDQGRCSCGAEFNNKNGWGLVRNHLDHQADALAADLTRERDEALAAVERVRALADEWEARGEYGDASLTEGGRAIRAALGERP